MATTLMVRPPRPNLLKRRHVGFAQRHIVVDDEEEAEVRYRHALQRHRQRLTYDRMKIRTVLFLKKNKSLHSVLKSWWRFKRLTSMDKEKQKQTFLTFAVLGHVLSRYHKRGQQLHSGLAKVAALVFIPFATPPLIVLGIPSLVLFLPLWILVWAILTLNRSAKKVLLQNRRVKGKKSASLTRRLSQFLSFREVNKSSSVTTTTTTISNRNSGVRKQAIVDNHKRQQADEDDKSDSSSNSSSTSSLRRTSTFESTTDATVATSTETTNLTNGTVVEGTTVMDTVPKLPTIVESSGNSISKRTPRRNASWNVLPRKSWAPKTTLASKSLERRPSMYTN